MNYRVVDIGGILPIEPSAVHAGAVPDLRWLPIDDLVIDDGFQRPLAKKNWAAIHAIAKGFSWGKFAAIVASPVPGGKYSLIDGQHRTHAAALCGFTSVPAMIVVLEPKGQAASFAAINGNVTAMSPFHVYRAALAAGEPWALRAKEVAEAAGCRVMESYRSSARKQSGELYCIQLMRQFIAQDRAEVLRRGLAAVMDSGSATPLHFTEAILRPWLAAIQDYGAAALAADLAGFCAVNDLVAVRDGIVKISRQPEFRHRTIGDMTKAAFRALLQRFVEVPHLPVAVQPTEAEFATRMAARAASDMAARRRRGVA